MASNFASTSWWSWLNWRSFSIKASTFPLKSLLRGSQNLKRGPTTCSACLYLSRNFAYFTLHFSHLLHIAQKLFFSRLKIKFVCEMWKTIGILFRLFLFKCERRVWLEWFPWFTALVASNYQQLLGVDAHALSFDRKKFAKFDLG